VDKPGNPRERGLGREGVHRFGLYLMNRMARKAGRRRRGLSNRNNRRFLL
jgi:hypothetical protein